MGNQLVSWWSKFQRTNIRWLLFLGAWLFAGFSLLDSYVVQTIVPKSVPAEVDPFIKMAAYLSVGGILGTIMQAILIRTHMGKVVDAHATPFNVFKGKITKEAFMKVFWDGLIGAFVTAIGLYAIQDNSAALIQTLSMGGLVLIVVLELKSDPLQQKKMRIPVFLLVTGVVAASFAPVIGKPLKDLLDQWVTQIVPLIFGIFILKNILNTKSEFIGREGSKLINGTVYTMWRFIWLTVAGVIIAIGYAIYTKQFNLYIQSMWGLFQHGYLWILLTMILVFLSLGWKQTAKQHTTLSEINIFYSLSVFMLPVLTIFWNMVSPGTFQKLPTSAIGWIVMGVGILVALLGTMMSIAVSDGKSLQQLVEAFFQNKLRSEKEIGQS